MCIASHDDDDDDDDTPDCDYGAVERGKLLAHNFLIKKTRQQHKLGVRVMKQSDLEKAKQFFVLFQSISFVSSSSSAPTLGILRVGAKNTAAAIKV